MPGQKSNKGNEVALAKQLVAGIGKHFSNAGQLTFESATFTPAQLTASLQTLVQLRTDVDDAKAIAKAKLAAEVAQAPALRALMSAFVAFVKVTFGKSPDVLADFGLKPKKARTPLTVEQKAAAVAKSGATRKARGTKSKKQKAEIHGNVVDVVVTPVTAPAATPSPVASTSPGASGGSTPHA